MRFGACNLQSGYCEARKSILDVNRRRAAVIGRHMEIGNCIARKKSQKRDQRICANSVYVIGSTSRPDGQREGSEYQQGGE